MSFATRSFAAANGISAEIIISAGSAGNLMLERNLDTNLGRPLWELVAVVKYIDKHHKLPNSKLVHDWVSEELQRQGNAQHKQIAQAFQELAVTQVMMLELDPLSMLYMFAGKVSPGTLKALKQAFMITQMADEQCELCNCTELHHDEENAILIPLYELDSTETSQAQSVKRN